MTRRPDQHVIGEQAAAAVRLIWNEQGASVDEICKDYGEDLLVKTCIRGRVDPRPIWVQVKGTKRNCINESQKLPSVKITLRQLIRWSRFDDMVIVVLWDVANKTGWYAIPDDMELNPTELQQNGKKNIYLDFSRDHQFNAETADELAWTARLHAAGKLLDSRRHELSPDEASIKPEKQLQDELILQIFDIMHDLGFVDVDDAGVAHFDNEFRKKLQHCMTRNISQESNITPSVALDTGIMTAILHCSPVPNSTMIPLNLLYHIAFLIKSMTFKDQPDAWDGFLTSDINDLRDRLSQAHSDP